MVKTKAPSIAAAAERIETMSLDVYLEMEDTAILHTEPRIFIREDGSPKEITREEWDHRFPGREPVTLPAGVEDDNGVVYTANITHNLNRMAKEAGVYEHLWRPDEIGVTIASELIAPLTEGLVILRSDPERFKKLNPPNGWGTYEGLIEFVVGYLQACQQYPEAKVSVCR